MIRYQQSIFKVSVSTEAAGIAAVDLKELSKQVQEITPATNHAKYLDDYQYLLCREIMNSTEDVEYVKILRRFRIIAVSYIMRLAEILEQIKMDISNTDLKRELVTISSRMSHLIYKLEKSLLGDS